MDSEIAIEELSVTIKSIKVNNRKMTLSVFKQLPYEHIVDFSSLELKGTPWGGVNYYWGNQKRFGNVHLVWSKDNILKRCIVEKLEDYKEYLKSYGGYGHEETFCRELHEIPYGLLQDAIKQARYGNEADKEKAKMIFDRYKKIYENLKEMGQLYIAT